MEVKPGTRVLVTGASRGIGLSLARRAAARGAVLGLAARSRADLDRLAAELPPPPGSSHIALDCDVAEAESVRGAVARFAQHTGGVDVVVANAGVAHYGLFGEQELTLVRAMTEINWMGTVHTVDAALAVMLDQGAGHIVVVSSGAALRSFPGAAAYGATKAAQRMFAEALRHELADTGVSVTVVYPGQIATSLHDHEQATMPEWYARGPRAADPDALADRILAAVGRDAASVHHPPLVRLLGAIHGLSPRTADRLLRAIMGATAAPRRR